MKNLILGCLFIVPILFSNCKKDDDNIDCDFTLYTKKYGDFGTKLIDFRFDRTKSNCNKAKTSGESLIRQIKEGQRGCSDYYDNYYVSSTLDDTTDFLNELDCSDLE